MTQPIPVPDTVVTFKHDVPDHAWVDPLPEGHRFLYAPDKYDFLPGGDALIEQVLDTASKAWGSPLEPASEWWVVSLHEKLDPHKVTEDGMLETLGDHFEGTSAEDLTVLIALNDLPDDAGAEFRLTDDRFGNTVGDLYPHKQGRGLIFYSQHWHGNLPLCYSYPRVSLVTLARAKV